MKRRGLFITFEGIDGCGKSTQLALLAKHLRSGGLRPLATREPGGMIISERIRSIILDPALHDMEKRTELLLYLASRAQHVFQTILPALKKGRLVLCDRFSDATLAYQAGGRALDARTVLRMDRFAASGLKPDLTFLFDLPVPTAFARMRKAGRRGDRMEKGGRAFMGRVRRAYLRLAKRYPRRIKVIHAARTVSEIHTDVLAIFKRRTQHD